jgi:hypothetical protein
MTKDNQNPLTEIAEKIASGQTVSAKRTLTQTWRDAVPSLPVRFAVILVRLEKKTALEIIKRMKKTQSPPQIILKWEKDRVEVWTARGKKLHLGDLPSSDTLMLSDLGEQAKKYRPQILEIKTDDQGVVEHIAIELVRPETKTEKENQISQTSMIEAVEEIAENSKGIDLDLD